MTTSVLTIKNLKATFDGAKANKAKYVGVKVFIPGCERDEVIINPTKNFDSKLDYYMGAYNDDLTHKHAADVKINGFTYGNSFADIEHDLIG